MRGLYDLPHVYDIAFSWEGLEQETRRYVDCIRRHSLRPARHLLEPGCGTGRFLRRLPHLGYEVTGYDRRPAMVRYANERLERAGLAGRARAVEADMRTARFPRTFDAAYNAVNTIGYLVEDADVAGHLASMARCIAPGGVYVVQLSCAWEEGGLEPPDDWVCERAGVRVRTTWSIRSQDFERRLSRQRCRVEVTAGGRAESFEEEHCLRLWLDEDLSRLLRESGAFERVAVYRPDGREVPPGARITGRMGNLRHVLRRL